RLAHVGPAAAEESTRLPAALVSKLRALATDHGLTVNILFQGAWAILLSRYSGREKVIFGATRAGRGSGPEGAGRAVGLLIDTLPVPVRVDPHARLLPWLRELRALWVAMRPYEHTPLVDVQRWSRLPATTPLFDSLVVFESYQL